jgi:hypothetical protein
MRMTRGAEVRCGRAKIVAARAGCDTAGGFRAGWSAEGRSARPPAPPSPALPHKLRGGGRSRWRFGGLRPRSIPAQTTCGEGRIRSRFDSLRTVIPKEASRCTQPASRSLAPTEEFTLGCSNRSRAPDRRVQFRDRGGIHPHDVPGARRKDLLAPSSRLSQGAAPIRAESRKTPALTGRHADSSSSLEGTAHGCRCAIHDIITPSITRPGNVGASTQLLIGARTCVS